jgi:hypothetical protein
MHEPCRFPGRGVQDDHEKTPSVMNLAVSEASLPGLMGRVATYQTWPSNWGNPKSDDLPAI